MMYQQTDIQPPVSHSHRWPAILSLDSKRYAILTGIMLLSNDAIRHYHYQLVASL